MARIEPEGIILEAVARNTAAAIAVASLAAVRGSPDAILVVMPSDHMVRDESRFVKGIKRAAKVAASLYRSASNPRLPQQELRAQTKQ